MKPGTAVGEPLLHPHRVVDTFADSRLVGLPVDPSFAKVDGGVDQKLGHRRAVPAALHLDGAGVVRGYAQLRSRR